MTAKAYEIRREPSPFGTRWIVYVDGRRRANCPCRESAEAHIKEETTMTDLSPSARALLEDADENGFLYSNSGGLKGGVAVQVRKSLVANGLLEQRRNDSGFGDPCEAFGGDVLRITEKGFEAIGKNPPTVGQKPATQSEEAAPAPSTATEAAAKPARRTREGGKTAKLKELVGRPGGASIDEIVAELDWQPHTARAAISRLDPKPASAKDDKRGRVYSYTTEAAS